MSHVGACVAHHTEQFCLVDWFCGFGLVDWIWYVWFYKGPGPQPMMMTMIDGDYNNGKSALELRINQKRQTMKLCSHLPGAQKNSKSAS